MSLFASSLTVNGSFLWFIHQRGCYSGVASPKIWGTKMFWRGKMFYFRLITLFCLEKRVSSTKWIYFLKICGGHGPFGPSLATPMGCYAFDCWACALPTVRCVLLTHFCVSTPALTTLLIGAYWTLKGTHKPIIRKKSKNGCESRFGWLYWSSKSPEYTPKDTKKQQPTEKQTNAKIWVSGILFFFYI